MYFGTFFDPESAPFQYHMVFGLCAAFAGCVRIVLGLIGTPQERWRAFFGSIKRAPSHFRNALLRRPAEGSGVNSGTALAAAGMYVCLFLLVYSGFDLSWGETWHGRFSNVLLGLIAMHIGGLVWDAVACRGRVWLSMFNGRKEHADGVIEGRPLTGWGWAMGALLAIGFLVLLRGLDSEKSSLRLPWIGEVNLPFVQRG